jgi:hypothetical protein
VDLRADRANILGRELGYVVVLGGKKFVYVVGRSRCGLDVDVDDVGETAGGRRSLAKRGTSRCERVRKQK